jgi:hypothetical protein
VDAPGSGYYRLVVQAGDHTRETSVGVLPEESIEHPDVFFGVSPGHTHFDRDVVFPLYEAAGMQTVRRGHKWATMEPRRGEYNLSAYDWEREYAAEHGLELFPILAYGNRAYHDEEDWYGPKTAPINDTQRRAFARYAGELVAHYDDVEAVEVWNEYDHSSFSQGPARHEPQYYAKLLKPTYQSVKEANPDVTVVGGAVAGGSSMKYDWWRGLFENGGGQYMDAMSIHPYRWPKTDDLEEDVEQLRTITRNHTGEAKPIWMSEMGALMTSSAMTQETQAYFVPTSHVHAKAAGVERYYWYNFVDQSVDDRRFGLVRNPNAPEGAFTPKPAFVSYATMTRHLSGATPLAQRHEPVSDYAFETPAGETKHLVWADLPTPVTIESDDTLEVTTIMGETKRLEPHEGVVHLPVSAEPYYLTGSIDSMTEGSPVTLEAPNTAVGDSIPVTATLDNRDGANERTYEVRIGETTRELSAAPGENATATISIPAGRDTRSRTIRATLRADGEPVGLLRTEATVTPAVSASVATRLEDGGGRPAGIDVRVDSHTDGDSYTITGIDWTVNETTGSETVERTLAPGSTEQFSLSTPTPAAWNGHDVSITVSFADRQPIEHQSTLSFSPIAQRTITVDGKIDDGLDDVSHISLPADGATRQFDDYGGPSDLSGDVWLTYDEDHLYLSAAVTDENHTAGWPLWEHDSIQLGVAPGNPGDERRFSEFQIALAPDGPRVFRGYQPTGPSPEDLSSAREAIVRQSERGRTVYEVAIPWSDLRTSPGEPTSLSLLINENDGTGRLGWIEWASGIGANKDTSKFYPVQFVGSGADTGTGAEATRENGTASESEDTRRTKTTAPGPGVSATVLVLSLAVLAGLARRRPE